LLEPGYDIFGGGFTNHSSMHRIENGYVIVAKFVNNIDIPIGPKFLEVPSDNLAI
jgi:hypothetical protein